MNSTFYKSESNKLILFFSGWGLTTSFIEDYIPHGYNLISLSGYKENSPFQIPGSNFNEIHIIAWSLGIVAAEHILQKSNINITSATAVCGSLLPVSNEYGIPKEIYFGTRDNLTEATHRKFIMRVAGDKENFTRLQNSIPNGNNEELKNELSYIYNLQTSITPNINWTKIILSKNDRIFPHNNLVNYWKERAEVLSINAPHFPFSKISLGEIIKG